MRYGNVRLTAALFFLLAFLSISFSSNPCSSCFATYIGLTEYNGTINATVFMVNQSTIPAQNLAYFDTEMKKYLSGTVGTPTAEQMKSVVAVDITVTPVNDSELYFYFYNRTGGKEKVKDLDGNVLCSPAKTSNVYSYAYEYTDSALTTTTRSGTFSYATCTIPKELYENSSLTVYVEYKGTQTLKPSQKEIIVYDISAGGLNVLASKLQDKTIVDPTKPECLAGLIMLGLLLASMYFSGKSPFAYLDITVPRVPKPKQFSFGPLTATEGNLRLSMPTWWNKKFLDILIRRHSKIDLRGSPLSSDVENAIERSKASELRKYFAKIAAAQGKDWKQVLERGDEKTLVRQAEKGEWGSISNQLLMVMNQRVAAEKVLKGMSVVGGSQHKPVAWLVRGVRRIPMIGSFVSIASTSFYYAFRTARLMLKSAASPLVRVAMGKTYADLSESEAAADEVGKKVKWKEAPKGLTKYFYGIASMTDTKKMQLGKLFQIHEYAQRFYEDTRDAMYDEVVKNILWNELYAQLKREMGEAQLKATLSQMMDMKKVFSNPDFLKSLEKVHMPAEYIAIFSDVTLSPKRQAELLLEAARHRHTGAWAEANALFNKLDNVEREGKYANAYEKAKQLVRYMRETHHINEPHNLSDAILNGKFFITTGRNNLYYEENGLKKNFGYLVLSLKEFVDQMTFLALRKRTGEGFGIADAFKLAWLKITSHVFGHNLWYLNDADNMVTVPNPLSRTRKQLHFAKDILGLDEATLRGINTRLHNYLEEFMTPEGRSTMLDAVKRRKATGVDDFLYSYNVNQKRIEEETTLIPWKRRQWYFQQGEPVPEDKYWRANMNFLWTSVGQSDKRVTLLHEVRGEKYWANMPRPENAWSLIEHFLDGRIANIMNGTQWDFYGYETRDEKRVQLEQFKRFSRVDTQKYLNETWDYYSKVDEALRDFFGKMNNGKMPANAKEFEDFVKNTKITYDLLRNARTPFIYTHDMSYIPYVKGLAVSDFDRIVNGVFVLQDGNGTRSVNISDIQKYRSELEANPKYAPLNAELNALEKLKKPPMQEAFSKMRELMDEAGISGAIKSKINALLSRIEGESYSSFRSAKPSEYALRINAAGAAATEIMKLLEGLPMPKEAKSRLIMAAQEIHPNAQPLRTLTREELEHVKKILRESDAPSELKMAFLNKFSHITHDWKSLWTDMDFVKLVPESEVGGPKPSGFLAKQILVPIFGEAAIQKVLDKIYAGVRAGAHIAEPMIYAAGRVEAEAMADNVAVSELYRERGMDIRMRVKGLGFLDNIPGLSAEDKKVLMQDYHNYANSYERFFAGWIDSVTRDARGSSTQWGRQWYLQTMYHRGGAMHPEAADFGQSRSFHTPLGWFFTQPFYRAASLNWMLGSPFVRLMRGFQTAAFGYPTFWDKNLAPSGDFDLLHPWQYVEYTNYQRFRAMLNPAESVFSLKKFNLADVFARSIQVVPGLNMLPYIFPKLDIADSGGNYKSMGSEIGSYRSYQWLQRLANVPGLHYLLGGLVEQSHTQRSGRAGMDLVKALKQKPEDFLQYKGGGYVHHYVDQANPGVSYVDYTGRGRLAPRMARYLVNGMSGAGTGGAEAWRDFYSEDEFVRRQSTFSMARRGIAAEVKRYQFQEEFTGYGPSSNPMWAPLTTWWLGQGIWKGMKKSKLATGITGLAGMTAFGPAGVGLALPGAAWQYKEHLKKKRQERDAALAEGREPTRFEFVNNVKKMAQNQYARFQTDVHTCMYCNRTKVARGWKCPACGLYGG